MTHFNLTALTTMCGGDPKFMRDFIQLFIDTTPPYMEEIKKLRSGGKWSEIGEILHKIKPTVELFGMMHIHGEIKLAEHAGRHGHDLDKMEAWLDHILPQLEVGIEALREEVKKYH
ncbi:MAG: Hpt domain-containing protein [Bacteroidota bacterium]|nr:Hpt domain-containing protein [Bacteroidota bacterium]MDX5431416.1 Hpt domain-containing protein [Bacteroidota bacterium]MDX5470144.1 Hpt domain-containing protein [Bacteroidota bacterium]